MSETLPGAVPAKSPAVQSLPRLVLWRGLFALLVVGWILFLYTHPTVLPKIGIGHYQTEVAPGQLNEIWFLDTYAILASNDAAAIGENPYLPNRLDYIRRPHVYGPAWLHLRHLGINRSHTFVVGTALAAAFVLIIIVLLRPEDVMSLLWYTAIVCSTPVLAALERGNNDLVVFLLIASIVPCLMKGSVIWHWLAVLILGIAVALKYYPAAGILILLACGSAHEIRWRIFVTAVMFAMIGFHVVSEVPIGVALPAPRGPLTFGAVEILQAIGADGIGPQIAVVFVGLLFMAVWWRSPVLRGWRPSAPQQREWMNFVLGAAVLTGCFFAGQHFAYRWIFAVLMAPFLWTLSHAPEAPLNARRLARILACLLITILWTEAVFVFVLHGMPHATMMAALNWISLGMQPLTWAFFVCLLGFLVHFARLTLHEVCGWQSA